MPGRRGQLLHRHHRGRQDKRQEKNTSLEALRQHFPVGAAQGNAQEERNHHGCADKGKMVGDFRKLYVHHHVGHDRGDQNEKHDPQPDPVDVNILVLVMQYRRMALLLHRRGNTAHDERDARRHVRLEHVERIHAVDPHHGRRRVSHDAARAAGVRGRDDRREIADVDLGAEQGVRHGAADQRRSDVVEKRRQHEHDHEQRETTLPVVRKEARQHCGHARLLEVPRQQRKTEQQAQQVGENHPLAVHMS